MAMAALLLLAAFGWHVFFARRTHVPMSTVPILLVSAVVVTEYAAGFFNMMRPVQLALVSAGLLAGGLAAWQPSVIRRSGFDYLPQAFLALAVPLAAWLMQGAVIVDFDDFSHWYRICKILHEDGGLPTTPDLVFRSYVPGAALWVSFVTRFVGFSPASCFVAHRTIGLAAICVFFLPLELKSRKTWTVAAGTTGLVIGLTLVSGSLREGIYNLLVDKTVALVAAAAFCMLACGRQKATISLPLLIVLLFLALIKCSALLFAVVLGGFAAVVWWKSSTTGRQRACALIAALGPVVIFASYVLFIRMNFPGHHSMGSHAFPNVPAWIERLDWIGKVIGPLTRRFLSSLVACSAHEVRIFLVGVILAVIALFLQQEKRWIGLSLIMASFWILGMFLTYVLEMTPSEIHCLASFNRYLGTLALFMLPTLALCLAPCNGSASHGDIRTRLKIGLLGIGAVIAVAGSSYGYLRGCRRFQSRGGCSDRLWRCLEASFPESKSYSGAKYSVVYDDDLLSRATDTPDRLRNGCSLWLRTPVSNIRLLRKSEVRDIPALQRKLKGRSRVLKLGMKRSDE